MSLSTTFSRRRPTTYGKRSRPHVPNLSLATDDEFGTISIQDRQDSAKELHVRTPGAQIPSSRVLTSAITPGVKKASEIHTLNVLEPSLGGRKIASGRLKHVQAPLRRGLISPNSDTDALYDVPSSDEEESQRNIGLHGPTVGKRRKIASAVKPGHIAYVYDDETLQRHVAAEDWMHSNHIQPKNGQTVSKRRPRLSQDRTKKSRGILADPALGDYQALSVTQSVSQFTQRPATDDASEAKTLTSSSVSDLQPQNVRNASPGWAEVVVTARSRTMSYEPRRSSDNTHMGSGNRHDDVHIGVGITKLRSRELKEESPGSTTAISQPQTPPHTPPRSSKPMDGSTTPRQRELWGMLLKDSARILSPNIPDFPSPKIADPKADNHQGYLKHREGRKDSSQQMPSIRNPRKRLVDNLQRIDEIKLHSSDDVDEKTADDSDDAPNNGPLQASPRIDILENDASKIPNGECNDLQTREPASLISAQALPQGAAPKVTYARQRSYLTEDDLGDAAMFGEQIAHPTATEAVKGRRRVRTTVAEFELIKHSHDEMDDLESSQGGTMRSIHELREAGGTVRLLSEMETMLDDIDEENTVSVTLKRATLSGLVAKLREASSCRLFIGQGLELRLLANFGLSNDVIVNALYAVAIWHLLAEPSSIQILPRVRAANVVNHLVGLLDDDQDLTLLLRDRRLNMSKVAQQDLKNLFSSLLASTNWRAGSPPALTPRVLCLQCLEYLIRQVREAGSDAQVLPPEAIRHIVKLLKPKNPISASPPSLSLTTDLRLAVSILESSTLNSASLGSELLWTDDTLDIVVDLLPLLVPMTIPASGALQTLVLRFYLNLTNNSPEHCKAFSRPNLISALFEIVISHFRYLLDNTTEVEPSLILDNLILSLGSLLNLAEWCEDLGHMVLDLRYRGITYLHKILEIFMAKLEEAGEVGYPSLI